jgi:hypothetical protein
MAAIGPEPHCQSAVERPGSVATVPALLHDQAYRRGHRPGPVNQLQHRRATPVESEPGSFTKFTFRLPRH